MRWNLEAFMESVVTYSFERKYVMTPSNFAGNNRFKKI